MTHETKYQKLKKFCIEVLEPQRKFVQGLGMVNVGAETPIEFLAQYRIELALLQRYETQYREMFDKYAAELPALNKVG